MAKGDKDYHLRVLVGEREGGKPFKEEEILALHLHFCMDSEGTSTNLANLGDEGLVLDALCGLGPLMDMS